MSEKKYLAIKSKEGLFFTGTMFVGRKLWVDSLNKAELFFIDEFQLAKKIADSLCGEVVEVTVVFNG